MSFNKTLAQNLVRSSSEHNVYLTYVCLVNHGIPTMSNADLNKNSTNRDAEEANVEEDPRPIRVERTKADHELLETCKKNDQKWQNKPTCSEESEISDLISDEDNDFNKYDNPKVLKLTKMKWLSEDQPGYPDSSTPSVTSARSTTSSMAEDSEDESINYKNVGEKCLSTILRLDKEHNLFGMSNIAIIGSKQSRTAKQTRKDDEKPLFHQTAIVQICCMKSCCQGCKHRSTTDLPSSLKYGGCGKCMALCYDPPPRPCSRVCVRGPPLSCRRSCLSSCTSCTPVSPPTCAYLPKNPRIHVTCLPDDDSKKTMMSKSICKKPCSINKTGQSPNPQPASCTPSSIFTPPCMQQCTCGLSAFLPPEPEECCYGFRLKLNRKPKFDPPVIEITPRCSSILTQPEIARCCPHNPMCQPPSAAFPYLMPCYWTSRPSAPCSDPERCFHNPACMPPRRERPPIPHDQRCPKPGPCINCQNNSCLGKNAEFRKGLEIWNKIPQQPLKTTFSSNASIHSVSPNASVHKQK